MFSHFNVTNRWKLFINLFSARTLASCFGKVFPSRQFVPIAPLLLSYQNCNYTARWVWSNSFLSPTFGYDAVALTTRSVEVCLSARAMPEIYSELRIETRGLWTDFILFWCFHCWHLTSKFRMKKRMTPEI